MSYHCNHCGFDFFMEEGYEPTLDAIICPMCGKHMEESEV